MEEVVCTIFQGLVNMYRELFFVELSILNALHGVGRACTLIQLPFNDFQCSTHTISQDLDDLF